LKEVTKIVVPISLGILAFIGILLAPGSFFITPDFEIMVDDVQTNENEALDQTLAFIFSDRLTTTEFVRGLDKSGYESNKQLLDEDEQFVFSRIYYSDEVGISQSILIINDGWIQAKDVTIRIQGDDTFHIIDRDCPEIEDENQILKEDGKNYKIKLDRMSQEIFCGFVVNSVGSEGINRIIVTDDKSSAAIWTEATASKKENIFNLWIFGLATTVGILVSAILHYFFRRTATSSNDKLFSVKKSYDIEIPPHASRYIDNPYVIPREYIGSIDHPVIWQNNDDDDHTVTSGRRTEISADNDVDEGKPDGLFDITLKPHENFEFRFEKEGTYHYYCKKHKCSEGTIVIK